MFTSHKPTSRYQSGVGECIGDNALIEKAVASQSAAISFAN